MTRIKSCLHVCLRSMSPCLTGGTTPFTYWEEKCFWWEQGWETFGQAVGKNSSDHMAMVIQTWVKCWHQRIFGTFLMLQYHSAPLCWKAVHTNTFLQKALKSIYCTDQCSLEIKKAKFSWGRTPKINLKMWNKLNKSKSLLHMNATNIK